MGGCGSRNQGMKWVWWKAENKQMSDNKWRQSRGHWNSDIALQFLLHEKDIYLSRFYYSLNPTCLKKQNIHLKGWYPLPTIWLQSNKLIRFLEASLSLSLNTSYTLWMLMLTCWKQLRTLGSMLLPPKAATSPSCRGIWMASWSSRPSCRWSHISVGPATSLKRPTKGQNVTLPSTHSKCYLI